MTERKPEPMVTPRGMAWLVFIAIVLVLATIEVRQLVRRSLKS
jgi:hypothetical protein